MSGRTLSLTTMFILQLPSHQAFAERASVIYGQDNRVDYYQVTDPRWRQIADATAALVRNSGLKRQGDTTELLTVAWNSQFPICPTEPFYDQDTLPFCSGFLVAPDLIVTAGHCIRNQVTCSNISFVFGFRIETLGARPRSVPSDHVFACTELVYTVSKTDGADFAVARLDRPVTHVPPLRFRTSGNPAPGEPLTVMGHPSGLPLKVAGGARVLTLQADYFTANLDTYGGNSGSAVFNSVTGQVEGILVRGDRDYKLENGCMLSNICPDEGCGGDDPKSARYGEDVTLIERVLPYLSH